MKRIRCIGCGGFLGEGQVVGGLGQVGVSRFFFCIYDQRVFRSYRRVVSKEVKRLDIYFEKMDWGRVRIKGGYQLRGNYGLEQGGGSKDGFQRYLDLVIDWLWR